MFGWFSYIFGRAQPLLASRRVLIQLLSRKETGADECWDGLRDPIGVRDNFFGNVSEQDPDFNDRRP